ncbi:MAG: hypothetical protein CL610_02695 [Anaerolineaceae bacterium]|nr:hypothetical protein [Anaerolineaceae bacterium]
MPSVEWVEPAPIWNGRKLDTLLKPRLVEFSSDNFLPEFMEAMSTPGAPDHPADYLADRMIAGEVKPKLYQPLHGRYYLVTASLICRQLGLPDRDVALANGEKTFFVLRREIKDEQTGQMIEQAWVDEGAARGWHEVDKTCVLPDEQRHPMHPLSVCTQSKSTLDQFRSVLVCKETRTIYHGYLPTGVREKLLDAPPAFTSPQQYITTIESQSSKENFRYNEYDTRVVSVWTDLWRLKPGTATRVLDQNNADDRVQIEQMSLYLVLDLADYLSRALPGVWNAIVANNPSSLPTGSDRRAVYDRLGVLNISADAGTINLRQALRDRRNDLPLVRGEDISGGEPNVGYSFYNLPVDATLNNNVRDALTEETTPFQMSEEMTDVLQGLVKAERVDANGNSAEYFFVRLVYDYDPNCPPVVSERSQLFSLAKFFESDAPARKVRLELPSIKMQDLRKFKRGVGMQMSPELRDLMGRVNEKMIDGEGLSGSSGGWELGMICTFSLQIIFLVAFIVMFIFLILLNIVFWWLAFLKICFPIPKRT